MPRFHEHEALERTNLGLYASCGILLLAEERLCRHATLHGLADGHV